MSKQTDQSAGEVFDSLTGLDEVEISGQFGRTISDLTDDPSMWGRALIFIVLRRQNVTDTDAYTKAMGMTMKETTTFFAVEHFADDEESGKDEPQAEPQPGLSLSSVS